MPLQSVEKKPLPPRILIGHGPMVEVFDVIRFLFCRICYLKVAMTLCSPRQSGTSVHLRIAGYSNIQTCLMLNLALVCLLAELIKALRKGRKLVIIYSPRGVQLGFGRR